MTEIEHLRSTLSRRERQLRATRTLMQVMDLIHGCIDLGSGLTEALRLCMEATNADQWMLLRRGDGMLTVLASGSAFSSPSPWADPEDFLSRTRHVTNIADTPWFDSLPRDLHGFASLLSVPLTVKSEPPMAILLLSRRQAAFSRLDKDLLRGAGRLLRQEITNRRLEHHNAALASVLNNDPSEHQRQPAFLDTSFEALSRAYARVAEWQANIVEITNDLLRAPAKNADEAINRALARSGELARSDRTYLFQLRDPDRIDNTHEWVAPGITPMISQLQDMPADLMDEWRQDLEAGRAVHIPDIADLPKTSGVREVLMMQDIRSLLAVPMLRDGQIVGFVGFDSVRAIRRFLPVEIQLLQAVANAVNVVLDRRAAEDEAKAARTALEAERDRLHATLEAIPDLVLELDQEGRFLDHVAGSGLQAAFAPEDFMGRLPEDVLPPDLAAFARGVMRMVDRDGHATGQEYELCIDGVPHWFSLSAAVRCEQGRPVGYVFVIRDITGEIVQRQHLQRLGKIAELTSNLVVITDAKQKIEWVNPAFERRTGWPLAEIKGKRPDAFLASEKTDRSAMRRIGDALRAGQPVRAELQHQTRWGEDYWISKDIQPLFGIDNRIEGYIAVQTDITDITLLHQKQLQDRAFALDASGDGIATTDATGHYVYMNAAHRRMFGIGENEDIRGIHWQDLFRTDVAESFVTEHWEEFSARGAWRGELDGLHRDGHPVPQDVSLTLRGDGILCITRDISERRQMERELRNRAVALDAATDGIAITDASGHYIYMNAAHRQMFGIGEDEDITELHWQDLYREAAVQRFMSNEWSKLQQTGSWRGELHGLHRDGSAVPQEVSLNLHNGGILCMTRDISEQLRQSAERANLREELQIAQRRETIAHLASGVAHDLNNLVAVVSGSIGLLEDKVAGDEDAGASVERIRRAADTARDLVAGLGSLGSPRGARASHDLRHLLIEGVELLGSRRQRDHMCCTSIPDTPCPVWANVTELLQVIVNLALNACEASDERPNCVSLAICEDGTPPGQSPDAGELRPDMHYTVFTVSDTGTGIDPEARTKLFQKYFSTKGHSGTGLGLPIVAGILRNNSAAIWFDSTPGQGTQVTIAWPAAAAKDSPEHQKRLSAISSEGDLDGRNILVVDDLPDVADVLSEMLDAAGANAVAVSDPQEAAELLQGNADVWAALLTDLDMPEPNGRTLARMAAACQPSVPTVLVTALPDAVDNGEGLFDAVLPKPVKQEQLIAALRAAICFGSGHADEQDDPGCTPGRGTGESRRDRQTPPACP